MSREFRDDTRLLCTTRYKLLQEKNGNKSQSQGGESDGPLTFATRNKRAGARVRYITRQYYRGFSDHSDMSVRFGGWITRARPAA